MNNGCIFCKIVAREIPSQRIYEDEWVIAFNDIKPAAPVHILVVPKMHCGDLVSASEETLSHMMSAVKKIANEMGLEKSGFRTVINTGKEAGQEIFHLHLHILGGTRLGKMA